MVRTKEIKDKGTEELRTEERRGSLTLEKTRAAARHGGDIESLQNGIQFLNLFEREIRRADSRQISNDISNPGKLRIPNFYNFFFSFYGRQSDPESLANTPLS